VGTGAGDREGRLESRYNENVHFIRWGKQFNIH